MVTEASPDRRTVSFAAVSSRIVWCSGLLLASALAGCSGSEATHESSGRLPAPPRAGGQLFTDTFQDDSNGWALPDTEQGRMRYDNGDFVWESRTPNVRPHVLATPLGEAFDRGELQMRDVVVTSDVTPEQGKAAVGVFCREVRDTDSDFQWYEFVARDGYAAIRRADTAGHLDILTKTSNVSLPLGRQAHIQAACVDDAKSRAQLWLSIDGRPVLYTRDDHPLGNGAPGLQAYDAPGNASKTRFLIRWHDFTVSEPA
jgi:hypothetical protein